jgi:hypothetical protein
MSDAITSSTASRITSWLEASGRLLGAGAPSAEAAIPFENALQDAASADSSSTGQPPVSGLASVFCPGLSPNLDPKLASALCPFGTGVPHQGGSSAPDTASAGSGPPPELAGVFRDVPEDSIEPYNAVLFWRRPENPPDIAWRSKLVLAEALRQAGYDPKDFAVSYWETKGEWPGGMMVVPQLTVLAPNGHKADLSPELIVSSPRGAVEDIRRLMESSESGALAVS